MTNYEILSAEETASENGKPGKRILLRIPPAGSTAELFIPSHTQEEEKQIGADFAHYAFRIAHPDENASDYRAVKIVP